MHRNQATWLWRIEDPNTRKANYLFGTMHVQDQRVFKQWEAVMPAILETDTFATEIKLEEAPPLRYLLAGDHQLSQQLPARQYQRLRQFLLRSMQVDLDQLEHLPPILLLQMLQQQLLRSDRFLNLDAYLYQFAKRAGKITYGLEGLDDQLALLRGIPTEEQLQDLCNFCQHLGAHRRRLERSVELYARCDLPRLHQLVRRQLGKQRRLILLERNHRMTNRFWDLSQEAPLFAAVGAGHLWGGNGMLRLLKHRGMRIRPVQRQAVS